MHMTFPLSSTLRVLASAAVLAAAPQLHAQQPFVYHGLCDASAAVALGPDRFIVANDERNTLKIYRRDVAEAQDKVDAWKFLGTKEKKESDLEGAAILGQRIYWISSHGRNASGEVQERRWRFFASDLGDGLAPPELLGTAYTNLLADMKSEAGFARLRLAAAAERAPEAPETPTQPGGLNIEGLAAAPQGQLLIGLRSPLLHGKALLLPLQNPAELVENGGKRAKFGSPIELDLGGRGVRSIELVGTAYLIVAGPTGDSGSFALYRWSGQRNDAAVRLAHDFKTLRPEALFAIPGSDTVQILSDDGGEACKDLPEARQTFRGAVIKLPPAR
ncbi:DUF3616 domain-containing protein [Janthinobacterium fluminis]|uniref:DUF3616 domain-containing protein n=1 Tax=Janthinobacterium fluminis TaxID=2987524 RepID=A0ABT5K1N4_9BURK|nr:DUF3616 domain-containing protein [Janthinobacterium fluminis]MDC8758839.1 DUF3616 domain-containing protein [Janthinobacterium fluminis]